MQNEFESIIKSIKSLKDISPDKNWAILTKNKILAQHSFSAKQEESFDLGNFIAGVKFLMSHKYAFSSLVALIAVVGIVGMSSDSGPGDTLYSLKKTLEQSQTILLSKAEKAKFDLEQANSRLEDLQKIAKENQPKKLGAAINEYKASVSEVAKNINNESDQKKLNEMAKGVKELAQKEREIKSLGIIIDDNVELDAALVSSIMKEVINLQNTNLNEEQKKIVAEIEEDCKNGNFADALVKITSIKNENENNENNPEKNDKDNNAENIPEFEVK